MRIISFFLPTCQLHNDQSPDPLLSSLNLKEQMQNNCFACFVYLQSVFPQIQEKEQKPKQADLNSFFVHVNRKQWDGGDSDSARN